MLWEGLVTGVKVIDFPQAIRNDLLEVAHEDPSEIDLGNRDTVGRRKIPMPHQERALESWRANGNKGIFKHATGSGKTFTAL